MRMAFLGIPVLQKKPLHDHGPSSSEKKAEDSKDLPGEHLGRTDASPASLLPACIESGPSAFMVALLLLLLILLLLLFLRQHQKLVQ